MARNHFLRFLSAPLIVVLLLSTGTFALAQTDAGETISIGENKAGQLGDASASARYTLSVDQPQSALVQVLAMTTGLLPSFSVVDPNGVVLLDVENAGNQTVVQGTAVLPAAGDYGVVVRSSSDIAGQFLVSIQPGAPIEAAQSLGIGQNAEASVSAQIPQRTFHVTGSPADALLLTVRSSALESGPVVTLRDTSSNETLLTASSRLSGLQVRIPAAAAEYQVDISHSGGAQAQDFIICVESERELPTCPLRQQTAFTPETLATPAPQESPVGTIVETPVAVAGLDSSQSPVFGSTATNSGFVPDPITANVTSGGPIDVSSAGADCSGFATSAPSFALDYTAGPFPVLRFYFAGAGDTSIVVSTPDGAFVCNDDSFGTFNPSVDISGPASGRYNIWVASNQLDAAVGGILSITENTNNHP